MQVSLRDSIKCPTKVSIAPPHLKIYVLFFVLLLVIEEGAIIILSRTRLVNNKLLSIRNSDA